MQRYGAADREYFSLFLQVLEMLRVVADVTGGQCQKWALWEMLYLIDVSQATICCGIVCVCVCGHVFIHFNLSNTTLTKENDSVFLLSNTLTYTPAEV